MDEQFITYGSARILVCNITYDDVYYSSDIGQEERDASDLNNDMILILCLAAAGVAIASVIAQYVSAGLIIANLLRRRMNAICP